MKTWFSWLALASLIWAIPPAVLAQDSMTDDSAEPAAEEVTESAPAPTAMAPAPKQGSERIEATVEQLEQLINAPEEARLGREVDEKDQPSLFEDKKRIDELLGDNPRYVYVPSGTDPMIVPWVRNRVMAAELLSEAKELYSTRRLQDALDKLNIILTRFGDSDSVEKARELKIKVEADIASKGGPSDTDRMVTPGPTPPSLPIWIPENTRGIIFDVDDPNKSSVLIGEYILHPGQAIPSYPGIKVVAIDRSRVTLDYQGQVFQLQVEGN